MLVVAYFPFHFWHFSAEIGKCYLLQTVCLQALECRGIQLWRGYNGTKLVVVVGMLTSPLILKCVHFSHCYAVPNFCCLALMRDSMVRVTSGTAQIPLGKVSITNNCHH